MQRLLENHLTIGDMEFGRWSSIDFECVVVNLEFGELLFDFSAIYFGPKISSNHLINLCKWPSMYADETRTRELSDRNCI